MLHKICAMACCVLLAASLSACAPASAATSARDQHRAASSEAMRTILRAVVRPRATAAQQAPHPPAPAFEYVYQAPQAPDLKMIFQRVVEADLLRVLPEVQALDGMFALPRRLRYVTAECGEFGAFYYPAKAEVVLCYETLRSLYERGVAHQQALGLGEGHPLHYVRANVRFILMHETGHALVDLLDLPVTGRLEDAVDQLATILMLRFAGLDETPIEVTDNLRLAANWLLSHSTGVYDVDAYANEHALGEQRFFNLQCLVYGTDPEGFAGMVAAGELTAARAQSCARETRQASRAWVRLLMPYLAPGYEAYEAEAARYLQRP